jgi:hypothetical protein
MRIGINLNCELFDEIESFNIFKANSFYKKQSVLDVLTFKLDEILNFDGINSFILVFASLTLIKKFKRILRIFSIFSKGFAYFQRGANPIKYFDTLRHLQSKFFCHRLN